MSALGRVIDRVAPVEIGGDFRRLLGAQWAANLGDGVALAAGPLLVASQTSSPTLVALATILQRLPWMLFGLVAGIVADRVDRRWLMVAGDASRVVVLGVLVVVLVADRVNIGLVLATMFLLGVSETFTDISADSLIALVVPAEKLGVANARFVFGQRALNQLAGPPIGAALFAAGMFVPFTTQAVLLALSVWLVAQMGDRVVERSAPVSVAGDVVDGVRWLWSNRPVRTLTLTILVFNVTWGATHSILVLYALERLGLDDRGFGLLLAASAIGGVLGAVFYDALELRFSLGGMMQVGLAVETLSHLGFAITTTPWVAMVIMFLFGFQASVWGTTARAVRQRAVPLEFQGRISSVYLLALHGGLVIGGLLGGAIGSLSGIPAVYWFAFVGSAILLAAIWRELPHVAHATAGSRGPVARRD